MIGDLQSVYPDPQTSTGLLLWRVTNSWQRAIRVALAPFELTHVQFVLLAALTAMDRSVPKTQRALAEQAATDPMMTSQVLRTLEDKHLIERRPHPTDGRARILATTLTGVDLVNRANVAVEDADRTYFSVIEDGVTEFTASLMKLDSH